MRNDHESALAAALAAVIGFQEHRDLRRLRAELSRLWHWSTAAMTTTDAAILRPPYYAELVSAPTLELELIQAKCRLDRIEPGRNIADLATVFFRGKLIQYHLAVIFIALAKLDNDWIEPRALGVLNGLYSVIALSMLQRRGRLTHPQRQWLFQQLEIEYQAIIQPTVYTRLKPNRNGFYRSSLEHIHEAVSHHKPVHVALRIGDLLPVLLEPAPMGRTFTQDPILQVIAQAIAEECLLQHWNRRVSILNLPHAPLAYRQLAKLARLAIRPEPGMPSAPLVRIAVAALRANHTESTRDLQIELIALVCALQQIQES